MAKQIGRMAAILSGLGQDDGFSDFGDMAIPDAMPDIPSSQQDWSGDYAISPDGTIDTASVYGNTGDVIQWDWTGSGANADVAQVINAPTPPADPIAAGLDPSKLIQTATGVYRYVRTLNPGGSVNYRSVLVAARTGDTRSLFNPGGIFGPAAPRAASNQPGQKSPMPLMIAAAAAFFLLR